jgi:hypothetical protein
LLERGSALLAELIQSAREVAIANGVRPIPHQVHRALLGYFPDAMLRKVRYAGGHADQITVPGLPVTYGHVDAVTLADVILFRDDDAARSDAKLWVHELTYVMQFERWGAEGLALHYLQDANAVEQEARDNVDRFVAWREHAHL